MNKTLLVLAAIGIANVVSAQTAIGEVPRIRDGLVHVGMAREIADKCSSLDARTLRGLNFLLELKSYAAGQGFSDEEIDDFIDNKPERRRLEAIARAQLQTLGAVEGQEATYCSIGRDQMQRNTRVGWLLR